jgi:hypothetical protein
LFRRRSSLSSGSAPTLKLNARILCTPVLTMIYFPYQLLKLFWFSYPILILSVISDL